MTARTKIGDLIFLNSKSPLLYKVVGKKPGAVQVENITNGFRMSVVPSRIISIRQIKLRKKEIESLLHNKLSGCSILDREDVKELEEELDKICSKLRRLYNV